MQDSVFRLQSQFASVVRIVVALPSLKIRNMCSAVKNQNIKDFDSLKGKKIAVQIGSTGAEFAKTIPEAKISTFNSGPEFFQDLINGNVDAVISDAFATLYAIKNDKLKGIKVVTNLLTKEYYGIATPQDSPHLEAINKGIDTLLSNGTYQQIYQKWFNTTPPKLPETAPA